MSQRLSTEPEELTKAEMSESEHNIELLCEDESFGGRQFTAPAAVCSVTLGLLKKYLRPECWELVQCQF